MSLWRDAVAGEQVGDEPRAGEPARDVVVQVGEQAAVARVELGRGGEAEHGGVERVEPEPRGGVGEARVGVLRPAVGGERQRLLVGDVEAAERVAGVGVAGRGRSTWARMRASRKAKPTTGGCFRRGAGARLSSA